MPKSGLYRFMLIIIISLPLIDLNGQSLAETANNFLKSHSYNPEDFNNDLRFSEKSLYGKQVILQSENPACYIIFQFTGKDTIIAAYSTTNIFSSDTLVPPVAEEFISHINKIPGRKLLKTGMNGERLPVGPLLKTRWSQDEWFNRYCPFNIRCKAGQNTYAGCIAVALAQVIRYYSHWNNFIIDAEHVYKDQTLSAFSTGYEWERLIDIPMNYELEACRMLADLGVQCKINYGISSSSQSTGIARKGINDMGFSNAFKAEQVQYEGDEWINMIYESLCNYSPVFVAGTGHAFVCDGYDSEGRLHFNLGWGGFADGYYDINCIYGNYCAREAILELLPDNDYGRPRSLRKENIEGAENICWSPPDDWEEPTAYRVYYSDDDYFDQKDTCIPVESLKPGSWGIMVSAVYAGGQSIWSGPVWTYNRGNDILISDTALLSGLKIPDDDQGILMGSCFKPEGILADQKSLQIEGKLSDPENFKKLYRLQELKINASGLDKTDLDFLSGMKNLQTLSISNLDDVNLPDLQNLSKLVELVLDSCSFKSLNSISVIDKLVVLELNNCRIEEFLLPSGLTNLECLRLNKVEGIPSILNLPPYLNLRKLEIFDCGTSRIELQGNMEKLSYLSIVNNQLENYEFLKYMPCLMKASLSGNEIKSLDIHTAFKFLDYLDLSNNKIDKTSIVYDIPTLKTLNLDKNEYKDFPGIFKHMPNLEALYISNNKLMELPGMKLPYLEQLDISGNRLTNIRGIALNESVKKLKVSNNNISDFSPLLCNQFYKNLKTLDISGNPVSEESYYEVLPELSSEIDYLSEPGNYESRSPCYPVPGSPASVSNKEIRLSWQTGESSGNILYKLYIGSGDSIKLAYDNLNNPYVNLRLSEGQKYLWQVAAVYDDTTFYSGLYELRTTTELELPYREDFELYSAGERITAASTNWRLTHGINDSYQDAEISGNKNGLEHGNSLHVSDYSNVCIDLDHLSVPSSLIIQYDQFIIGGRTSHISFKNIHGLNIDLYSNGYLSQIYIDGSYLSSFDAIINQWNNFRVSIQGQNERIFINCNGIVILNKQWNFGNSGEIIETIVFSSDQPAAGSPFRDFESYIDNLMIYDANDRTGVDDLVYIEEDVFIHPNPASQSIHFSGIPAFKDLEIEILDSRGRKILGQRIGYSFEEQSISIQQLDPGVYFYRLIEKDSSLKTGKFIIAR